MSKPYPNKGKGVESLPRHKFLSWYLKDRLSSEELEARRYDRPPLAVPLYSADQQGLRDLAYWTHLQPDELAAMLLSVAIEQALDGLNLYSYPQSELTDDDFSAQRRWQAQLDRKREKKAKKKAGKADSPVIE